MLRHLFLNFTNSFLGNFISLFLSLLSLFSLLGARRLQHRGDAALVTQEIRDDEPDFRHLDHSQ